MSFPIQMCLHDRRIHRVLILLGLPSCGHICLLKPLFLCMMLNYIMVRISMEEFISLICKIRIWMTVISSWLVLELIRNRWLDSLLGIRLWRDGFWFSYLQEFSFLFLSITQACKWLSWYNLQWLGDSLAIYANSTSSIPHLCEDLHANISFILKENRTWSNIIYLVWDATSIVSTFWNLD